MGIEFLRRQARTLFGSASGARAIAQTVVARVLAAGINVATGIVSARVLAADGRGEMSAMLVWPMLLAYVLTLGLPAAIRYWIKREPDRRSEFFTVAVIGGFSASLCGIALGVTFLPVWLHNYSPTVIHAAQFLMIFSPEVMLSLIFQAMLETLGEFNTSNLSRYVTGFLQLGGLLLLAIMHHLTPVSGAVAYYIAPVITALWLIWRLRLHFQIRFFDPRPAIRVLSSYGFRSYGIDLLNAVSTQVDQVLVVSFLKASDVGIYVVALSASRVLNILHQAVVTVVFPSAAGLEKPTVIEMVGRCARISTVIALAGGLALGVLLPFLIPLFYGTAFTAAVVVAQLLTLEAVIGGLVSVLAQSFMALGRPGFVTVLQALGLAAVLPLMYLFLPRFGLLGAALALLISTTLRLAVIALSYPLILKAPMPQLFPLRADFQQLRSALAKR